MDSWKFCDVIRIFRMDWNVFLEIKKKKKKTELEGFECIFVRDLKMELICNLN